MATVNTERALEEFRRRVGQLYGELVLRDVVIAELEERIVDLEESLRASNGSTDHPSTLSPTRDA